jgi:endonuclease III
MSKNEEKIMRLLKEIGDIENHIKLLKSTLKHLKEELKKAVDTDED